MTTTVCGFKGSVSTGAIIVFETHKIYKTEVQSIVEWTVADRTPTAPSLGRKTGLPKRVNW